MASTRKKSDDKREAYGTVTIRMSIEQINELEEYRRAETERTGYNLSTSDVARSLVRIGLRETR